MGNRFFCYFNTQSLPARIDEEHRGGGRGSASGSGGQGSPNTRHHHSLGGRSLGFAPSGNVNSSLGTIEGIEEMPMPIGADSLENGYLE